VRGGRRTAGGAGGEQRPRDRGGARKQGGGWQKDPGGPPRGRAGGRNNPAEPRKGRRNRRRSFPEVALLRRDTVRLQERHELILERVLPVVLLLAGDVLPHPLHLRRADGERPVAALPREAALARERLVYPAGR